VFLLLGVLAAPAQAQVELRWRFQKDDVFFVEEATTSRQTLTFTNSESRQELDYTRVSRFTVKQKNPDDSLVLEQKIETVKINRTGGATAANPKLLQQMEGATFRITCDAQLHVTRFEGYQELVKKMAGDDPELAKMVRLLVREDGLKAPVEMLLTCVPGKAVAPGATWESKITMPFGPLGSLATVNTFTFEGPDKKDPKLARAAVATAVTYTLPEGESGLAFQIKAGSLKATKASGSLVFNTTAGRLVSYESTRVLKGSLTVASMGRTQEMGIEQTQNSTWRVLEKNPLAK
jgi:hypothetical protein